MRAEGDIAIAGAGYVGLTSAACFCEMGHRVRLVEVDPERLAALEAGQSPIYEPGLADLLKRHLGRRLVVTSRLDEAVPGAQALFVCVGTPPRAGGAPDLRALKGLLRELRALPDLEQTVVVLKSTVPPGTNRMVFEYLNQRAPVVSNPEFLREGSAIHDFFHPDRVVVGSPDEAAALLVAGLYVGVDAPLMVTGWEEAELIKYGTNAFLAMKVSYANEMAALSDALGADALDILKGVGLDHRIGGQFLRPGPGYGGSCLPKDLKGLSWTARKAGVRLDLLPAAERANRRQRERLFAQLVAGLGGLRGKRVAVWGLAFKAGTDDLRSAASLELVPRLLQGGAEVRVHDPEALEGFGQLFPPAQWPSLRLCPDHWEALEGADGLLILTEWELYREAPPVLIRKHLGGRLLLDGRNLLDPDQVAAVGLRYCGVGRGQRAREKDRRT